MASKGGEIRMHGDAMKAPKPNPLKQNKLSVSGQLHMGPTGATLAEKPASCGKLDAYGMDIQHINSSVEYYGGHTNVDIDMKIRTFMSGPHLSTEAALGGSKALGNFEDFMRDIAILNEIKKSDHAGVEDLWNQIQEFLALTKKDK